jgi:hypothetical protein
MSEAKKPEMSEDELDQIIADMAKDEGGEPSGKAAVSLASVKSSPSAPRASSEQVLSMELQGVINLKLCFSNGDRNIELRCTEETLICRMADGTEFRIPTGARKRVAA